MRPSSVSFQNRPSPRARLALSHPEPARPDACRGGRPPASGARSPTGPRTDRSKELPVQAAHPLVDSPRRSCHRDPSLYDCTPWPIWRAVVAPPVGTDSLVLPPCPGRITTMRSKPLGLRNPHGQGVRRVAERGWGGSGVWSRWTRTQGLTHHALVSARWWDLCVFEAPSSLRERRRSGSLRREVRLRNTWRVGLCTCWCPRSRLSVRADGVYEGNKRLPASRSASCVVFQERHAQRHRRIDRCGET